MTDDDLLARTQAGRQEASADLVQRHHGAVFRAAHADGYDLPRRERAPSVCAAWAPSREP